MPKSIFEDIKKEDADWIHLMGRSPYVRMAYEKYPNYFKYPEVIQEALAIGEELLEKCVAYQNAYGN